MTRQETKYKWVFLSYPLHPQLSAYGNGPTIEIKPGNRMANGDNNNTSLLSFSAHFGTHIDFPRHFSEGGASGTLYSAGDFVFQRVTLVEIDYRDIPGFIIQPAHIPVEALHEDTGLLLIKTHLCHQRDADIYWENNPGLAPELAGFLKEKMPRLSAVGIDLISLSSWQRRDVGRVAHREFLTEHNLLVIEDMDLTIVDSRTRFETVIASPLRFQDADGGPATVFAKIKHEN